MKLDNNGFPIVEEKRITNDDGNATYQVIEIDPLNNIYIVWEDERHDNSEIYYMRVDENGDTLDDELRLTNNMSRSHRPQIVMNHEYKLNVVWADARDYVDTGASELYYKRTLEPAINFPPTIEITYPYLGQTVKGEIEIEGFASDSDGTVEFVQIKIDSGLWETASGTTDFIFPWDTTSESDGPHTIHARSFDGFDFSQEDNIYVIVNNTEPPPQPNEPPTILITPLQQDEVSGTITIQGTASDSDGSVEKVHIKLDSGGWRAASGTNSWSYSWDTTVEGDGEHEIYARAEDDDGDHSTLDSISVFVNNTENTAPSVNIIFPEGGTVSGFVSIIGTASDVDGDGTISEVQVNFKGTWETAEGTVSWAYIWDTTEDDEGTYEISARAFDGLLYSEIDSVSVTVDNPYAPTITMFTGIPDTVSGTFTIRGTSSDSDGEIKKIEIQIDSGDWILVTTSNEWEYDIKTEDLTNDIHTIAVRAVDDEGDSDLLIFTIIVKNEEEEIPWMSILILIFLMIIFLILATARRRSKSKKSSQSLEAFNLQTLKCPQCTNVFEVDATLPHIACPNCGYSANA
jgi:ribosomal protein L32